jgi:sensor histidine kinase regulating citrate/malate metabolism
MSDPHYSERVRDDLVHEFKNHLSVIVGFCDVLLRDLAEDDIKRQDVMEIQRAALAAVALLPRIPARAPSPNA